MNTIEIDDEVMEILIKNAEPFIEAPNDVLRKLLGIEIGSKSYIKVPSAPEFVPKALVQILQVFYLVIAEGFSRNKATNHIANKYSIFPQTVMDKYCRQLKMTAKIIDSLLLNNDIREIKSIIKSRFPKFSNEIDKYFNKIFYKSITNTWMKVYS